VDAHARRPGGLREGGHLAGAVDGAGFGDLGQAEGGRYAEARIRMVAQGLAQGLGCQLAVIAGQGHQRGAAGEGPDGAALADLDVGLLVAKDRAKGRCQ
jgi:hypothetical protein